MTIWELRFTDGRGASFFTDSDVTTDIGKAGQIRRIKVAAIGFEGSAISDARHCFQEGNVLELSAHMGAVAYAVRHDP